jgi:hypothetical protein
MRVATIVVSVTCALATFWAAFIGSMDRFMAGFPDGHVTDYDKAVAGPASIAMWVQIALGLYFLCVAFSAFKTRPKTLPFLIALAAFVLVMTFTQIAIPWYFGTYLGLDNGIGG